jgi:hypothetical protein
VTPPPREEPQKLWIAVTLYDVDDVAEISRVPTEPATCWTTPSDQVMV